MAAQVLEDSGWLRRLRAGPFVPRQGTCRGSAGKYTRIDYFLVSEGLDQAVLGVALDQDEPAKPHCPVVLSL
eukprot:2574286-Karenia_brevis.AAC.1